MKAFYANNSFDKYFFMNLDLILLFIKNFAGSAMNVGPALT